MNLQFSIIIPVYNRPNEVDELLESLTKQTQLPFEIIIVEDGSPNTCGHIVNKYEKDLNLRYFLTKNQGAGKSRNYGMQKATGNYFIIFDSDCLIPKHYLETVAQQLNSRYTDAFGGPDAAHSSFTTIQKAINYSMTSLFTTGGIRGKKKSVGKFQPRSFNLGISKEAFLKTNGFSDLKIGEDIDLTFRLWNDGFESQLIDNAFVYHKRRTSFGQFYKQTYAFGTARPLLNKRYPGTAKITYWFPSLFLLGFFATLILSFTGVFSCLLFYLFYSVLIGVHATIINKNLQVGVASIFTTWIQFAGYGLGFLKSIL